jgi:hypothetical protein
VAFYVLFQLSKLQAISAVNPFANDPYDAVGSIAVQVALAVGLLTLARLVRHKTDNVIPENRLRLILRGLLVTLTAIVLTISTDLVAVLQHPIPLDRSTPAMALLAGLGLLSMLTLAAAVAFADTVRGWRAAGYASGAGEAWNDAGALGEVLADFWALAEAAAQWLVGWLPVLAPLWQLADRLVRWVGRQWTTRVPWLNPQTHPWRFFSLVALGAGIALALAQGIGEGLPSNPALTLKVAALFIGIEFTAALLGFLVLGGFLGLRPRLRS